MQKLHRKRVYSLLLPPSVAILLVPLGFGLWQFAAAAVTGFIAKENVVGTLAVTFGISRFINLDELALAADAGAASATAAAFGITAVAALSYLVFNLFTPPCFAAIGAIRAEMNSAKWTWGAVGFQLAMGYTLAFFVYQDRYADNYRKLWQRNNRRRDRRSCNCDNNSLSNGQRQQKNYTRRSGKRGKGVNTVHLATYIVIGIVTLIIAGVVIKLVRDKKKGVHCPGCPGKHQKLIIQRLQPLRNTYVTKQKGQEICPFNLSLLIFLWSFLLHRHPFQEAIQKLPQATSRPAAYGIRRAALKTWCLQQRPATESLLARRI